MELIEGSIGITFYWLNRKILLDVNELIRFTEEGNNSVTIFIRRELMRELNQEEIEVVTGGSRVIIVQ